MPSPYVSCCLDSTRVWLLLTLLLQMVPVSSVWGEEPRARLKERTPVSYSQEWKSEVKAPPCEPLSWKTLLLIGAVVLCSVPALPDSALTQFSQLRQVGIFTRLWPIWTCLRLCLVWNRNHKFQSGNCCLENEGVKEAFKTEVLSLYFLRETARGPHNSRGMPRDGRIPRAQGPAFNIRPMPLAIIDILLSPMGWQSFQI